MAFTLDLTTDIGKMRVIIPDRREIAPVFTDEELEAFLVLESGVKRASALALESIASDQAYVLKVLRLQTLSTDGAKVSDALLKRAALLREQADYDDAASGANFAFAEQTFDVFTLRELLEKQYLRSEF